MLSYSISSKLTSHDRKQAHQTQNMEMDHSDRYNYYDLFYI